MKSFSTGLALVIGLLLSASVSAKELTKVIEYKEGETMLEGYYAVDFRHRNAPKAGILIVHDWKGLGNQAKRVAGELAQLGYAAFAVDIYGKGVRPTTNEEAGKLAGQYKSDRKRMRARIQAGLEALKRESKLPDTKIAAIGYCFGGTVALELARAGAPVAGVVSFHGGLATPTPADAKNIRAKVLVLHGAVDPNVPPAEVAAFEKEMNEAKVDWQLVSYSGAVHSFTNPDAGNDPSKGNAYNEKADRRSWQAMKSFFEELFAPAKKS